MVDTDGTGPEPEPATGGPGGTDGSGGTGQGSLRQEREPASEEVVEVAPDVLRMQLPIRMPGLGHVNTYALVDHRGATLVDPGLPGRASWRALEARLAAAGLRPRHVHTVLVTHSHVDHFGSAGRLAQTAGAELLVHEAFSVPWLGVHEHVTSRDALGAFESPWRERTPWGGDPFRPPWRRRATYWLMRRVMRRSFRPPLPSHRVRAGEVLVIGDREWIAVHTPGHTVDHVCFHDPAGGVLLSGDHVLPTITPHISGMGVGEDPLRAFVDSLEEVARVEPVSRVLPAHGHPFDDLRGRAEEIAAHHRGRLERLKAGATELGRAGSVAELSRFLFPRRSWGPMAESETYAHLEHLRLAGEAERSVRPDGVVLYELETPAAS